VADNVELAKRANASLNAGDVEGFMELADPGAELRDLANAPDQAQALKGKDAIRGAWTLWTEAFDELRAEVSEYTAVGDFVICNTHWVGRGKGSGISIDVRQFDLFEFRDGKWIAATLGLKSKKEALDAARE
jgi:ketosteroid isomerase-like protein